MVDLETPWALAACVLAVAPALLAWWRTRGDSPRASVPILQSLAVLLGVLALAGPSAPWGEGASKPYLVFTDVSDSTRGQRNPLPWPPEVARQSYVFARDAAAQDFAIQAPPTVATGETNISPVLRLALARASQITGVVIRTDGQFQDSDWPQLAASSARRTCRSRSSR